MYLPLFMSLRMLSALSHNMTPVSDKAWIGQLHTFAAQKPVHNPGIISIVQRQQANNACCLCLGSMVWFGAR
jgi:hypothetical protein